MSEIKVDTVGPRVDSGTLTIGAAGDTVNIAGTAGTGFPAGTTINNNADNRVITGSGTSSTLNGESNLTFDGDNLLLSANYPDFKIQDADAAANSYIQFQQVGGASIIKARSNTNDGSLSLMGGVNGGTYASFGPNIIQFYSQNTEKARMFTGGVTAFSSGIALGVGVADTASNVLDDYEEGTWTPNVANATVSSSTGHYTKIGNICYITIQLALSAIGSGNPSQISGLPFTANATSNRMGLIGMVDSRNNSTSTVELHLRSDTNSTLLIFVGKESDVANYDDDLNVMANSFSVNGSGWYTTA